VRDCSRIERSTSSRVMRPPDPLPETSARSISYSWASFLTDGEARPAPSSTSRRQFDSSPVASSAGGCSSSGSSSGCPGAAPSASPMIPITPPTPTASPSPFVIDSRTPSCSASTSKLILSVSSSTSASPAFTASPSCLSHFPTAASATDSPSSGTCISAGMSHQPSQNLVPYSSQSLLLGARPWVPRTAPSTSPRPSSRKAERMSCSCSRL
jgi:hypothetical protein